MLVILDGDYSPKRIIWNIICHLHEEHSIALAYYRAMVWHHNQVLHPHLPPITGYGWKRDEGRLIPITTMDPPYPASITYLIKSSCKKRKFWSNCSCGSQNFSCSELWCVVRMKGMWQRQSETFHGHRHWWKWWCFNMLTRNNDTYIAKHFLTTPFRTIILMVRGRHGCVCYAQTVYACYLMYNGCLSQRWMEYTVCSFTLNVFKNTLFLRNS